MGRLIAGKALLGGLVSIAICAQAASATTISLPAGYEVTLSNTMLGGCDANSYGYQVGVVDPPVPVASKPNDCATGGSSRPEPNLTVGPFTTTQNFRVYLADGSCSATYYSDGTPVNHALVSGSNPYTIALNDGGPGCPFATVADPPSPGGGNFLTTVTIVAAPPVVTVTAPAAPAGQNGYFNPANLAGNSGSIPVTVIASDASGTGMSSITCTDNSVSIPVVNTAGAGTATMTGTVKVSANGVNTITCLGKSAGSAVGNRGAANTATVKIDTSAPTLTIPTAPIVVAATSLSGAKVASYPVSATDADSGLAEIACTPAAPATFAVGNTSVSCNATDKAGNASATGTFTVTVTRLPPPAASFGKVSTAGPVATVAVVCRGAAGQRCTGTLTVTSHRSSKSGELIATAAAASPATVTNVVLGRASYAVQAGSSARVTLSLNAAARKVLAQLYSLTARISLPGASHTVTFRYRRISANVLYTVRFFHSATTFSSLTASLLPSGATVKVSCGDGCGHTFKPRGHSLNMSKLVAGRRFRPGARVMVTITALNRIGQVSVIAIRSDKAPNYSILCLPPGAISPAACHS